MFVCGLLKLASDDR